MVNKENVVKRLCDLTFTKESATYWVNHLEDLIQGSEEAGIELEFEALTEYDYVAIIDGFYDVHTSTMIDNRLWDEIEQRMRIRYMIDRAK